MKRSFRWAGILAVCCFASQAGQALAGPETTPDTFSAATCNNGLCTETANDTIIAFPGEYSPAYPIDTYNGIPDVTSMTIVWKQTSAGNVLQSITITAASGFMLWDSLFINNDYTGASGDLETWNYLVHNGSQNPNNTDPNGYAVDANGNPASVPGNGLYQVIDQYDYNYTYVSQGNGRMQANGTGHANGIDATDLNAISGSVVFGGGPGNSTVVYDFSSLSVPIYLGDNFAIGYTPYCANDVALATGKTGNSAVPEPATMALFGMGMVGLAGWRARRATSRK